MLTLMLTLVWITSLSNKNLTRFINLGKVLSLVDWVRWDSYLAYAIPNEDPRLGPRVLKVNPADTPASPRGWLDQGRSS